MPASPLRIIEVLTPSVKEYTFKIEKGSTGGAMALIEVNDGASEVRNLLRGISYLRNALRRICVLYVRFLEERLGS